MDQKRKQSRYSFAAIFVGFLFLYFLLVVARSFRQSLLFSKRDRVALVFYDTQATVLSLGLSDKVNYSLSFDNDARIITPGGYGRYRIGSLGGLVNIEKNPRIIQNAFSSTLSSTVDYYFISEKNILYDTEDPNAPIRLPKISLLTTIFKSEIATNANLIDRLYLFFLMAGKRRSDFIALKTQFMVKDEEGVNFSENQFAKRYKGFFYERFIRDEDKTVKIGYNLYRSAKNISRILEGDGIRVVDLSSVDNNTTDCVINESARNISKTARYISRILNCPIKKTEVSGADIQIILGKRVEKEWE